MSYWEEDEGLDPLDVLEVLARSDEQTAAYLLSALGEEDIETLRDAAAQRGLLNELKDAGSEGSEDDGEWDEDEGIPFTDAQLATFTDATDQIDALQQQLGRSLTPIESDALLQYVDAVAVEGDTLDVATAFEGLHHLRRSAYPDTHEGRVAQQVNLLRDLTAEPKPDTVAPLPLDASESERVAWMQACADGAMVVDRSARESEA